MPDIHITIKDKVATGDGARIVCGNSDYMAVFSFDEEWAAYDVKTARFVYPGAGNHIDVIFEGDTCPVPVLHNTIGVKVGVFAGELHTTTSAWFDCEKSILCGGGPPADPLPDVYAQIMELIQGLGDPDPEDIAAAVAEYMTKNPIQETDPTVHEWAKGEKKPSYTAEEVGAISLEKLAEATETALRTAKESGEFDGPPGKDGKDGQDGRPGVDGNPGKDGVSPTVSITTITGGNRVTIVDANGSKSFDVKDGKDGVDGLDGRDGQDGAPGQPGYTPQKGTDYWTAGDRQQMVSDVLEALPVYNGEVSEA